MRRAVSFQLATAQRLPGHLPAGGMRLLVACLAIWGLGMFSPSIDRGAADVVRMVGWGVILAGLLMLGLGTQRVLALLDFPLLGAGVARAAALLLALRRIGLVLLARPPDADVRRLLQLRRLDGFISPPGDIIAASKGARTATMIELLTGTAALAAYLGSFLDFGAGAAAAATESRAASEPGS